MNELNKDFNNCLANISECLDIIENNQDDVNLAIYELLNNLLVRLQDIQSKIKECL